MEIRQVYETELASVLDLIDEYDRDLSPRPADEELQRIFGSILHSGGVVGAITDDGMVGTCTVNICANLSWSGRPYAIIENVIVSKAYRKQGIGHAILRYAAEFAQQAGCYKVVLITCSKVPLDTHVLRVFRF
ncbi:GNAT family N-acetyltransferase [Vreelandella nigrificans]|uniref:GNAT family N-acetyltransferase n=1 Tax=Vreelandella nigrificans TaxID=2042704 RepID=A0A2A4HJH5_9GAMM|nr:GNAT family N-acetyltransferase [Halomonas nigrificans]PCF94355.1 GNAT family N-acetyltransferase [Halomonas nigrificans]